jgi:hypothetical protein
MCLGYIYAYLGAIGIHRGYACAYLVATISHFWTPVLAILPNHVNLQHPVIIALKPPRKPEPPAIIKAATEQCAHDTSYLNNSVAQNIA